jgi:hypothetical protein
MARGDESIADAEAITSYSEQIHLHALGRHNQLALPHDGIHFASYTETAG